MKIKNTVIEVPLSKDIAIYLCDPPFLTISVNKCHKHKCIQINLKFLKDIIVSGCKNSMEKDNGQCVPMSECKAFDVYKNKVLTMVERFFLSRFFCGVKNKITYMCCDVTDVVKNTTTATDTNQVQNKRNSF